MKEKKRHLKVHKKAPATEKVVCKTKHTYMRLKSYGSTVIVEGHSPDKGVMAKAKALHNPPIALYNTVWVQNMAQPYVKNPQKTYTIVWHFISVCLHKILVTEDDHNVIKRHKLEIHEEQPKPKHPMQTRKCKLSAYTNQCSHLPSWLKGPQIYVEVGTSFPMISYLRKSDTMAKNYEFFKKNEFTLQEIGFLAKKFLFDLISEKSIRNE